MPEAIAVIVPVGAAEAPPSELFFERVRGAQAPVSLIGAADARIGAAQVGISSNMQDAFARAGATLFTFEGAPRGARLARAALGLPLSTEIFLFLHADTALPTGWEKAVRAAIAEGASSGAFRLSFSGRGWRMRWVAFWANIRTAFTRMPYGDQAPFVRRDVYERIGGHMPWAFLDDWDLARRLRTEGRVAILPLAVETSPRRYLERGVARTVLGNWRILWKARRGESPERLARRYQS